MENDPGLFPKRLRLTGIVSVILIVGVIAHGIIAMTDDTRNINYQMILSNTITIMTLTLLINVKTYFAPIAIGIGCSIVIYYLINHGQNIDNNFIMQMMGWLFKSMPSWVSDTYKLIMTIYLLGSIYFYAE